jgi:hypothetical protein
MRRLFLAGAALLLVLSLQPSASGAPIAVVDTDDDMVTGQAFVRHDGGSDAGIEECNDASTDPTAMPPAEGDTDPNDGGAARQGNEPFVAVDPTNPDFVVAGWNDYCLTDLNAGWEGFAYSLDGGEAWTDSLVPGYPQDTSSEGTASPLFGTHRFAGDPIAAFDSAGNLFVGGISFNRAGAINGDVFVATYAAEDHPSGYPVDYLRTRIVGRGTPSRNFVGVFQDKPMLEIDRTGGDHDGNVYVCWSRFPGAGGRTRSTSAARRTWARRSPGRSRSRGSGMGNVQGATSRSERRRRLRDLADVQRPERHLAGRSRVRPLDRRRCVVLRRPADRNITAYFPFDGARDCGDGAFVCPPSTCSHGSRSSRG